MSDSVDQAFIRQYESDVHMAYQRMGSKLRNMVRVKNNVVGKSTTFQKVGKGTAVQKARHAELSTMNVDHTPVECTLADWYAGDYIDKLDELKLNIDERMVVAQSGAAALGRKTDELIIDALETSTNTVAAGAAALTQAKVETVFEYFGNNDVPDDGQRYFVIGFQQWTDLLGINSFASQDYVGADQLPYVAGMTAKRWMGFMISTHSGLTKSGSDRTCLAWHKSAIGHASGQDVTSEINYVAPRVAHLATSMMSQGAVLIDNTGTYQVVAVES